METEKVSLITGLAPKNKYWAIVCYVTVALTLILSITILILVQYLAGLNLLNQFLFYAEGIIQFILQSVLILAILLKKKTVILGCIVFGLLSAGGFLLTQIVILISQYIQLYSANSPAPLVPAHTDGWYKILSATTVVSMIQGISAIIAYVSGLKMRENIPDLVPKAVFRSSDEENSRQEEEDSTDPQLMAKYEKLQVNNAVEKEDDESNIISISYSKKASHMRENLLSNY